MKHVSIACLLIFTLTAACDSESQLVDRRRELDLILPYDVVDSGHVGEIPLVLDKESDRQLHAKFDSIQQFECAAVVYATLGKPIVQGRELPNHSFRMETLYEAKNYPIDQYVVWLNGDKLYCFGFAETAEVISKQVWHKRPFGSENN